MKACTMKEVSKRIKVSPRAIRQWEKELTGLLEIPRSKQGARIYTDLEINLLLEIKQMYAEKVNKEGIREYIQKKLEPKKDAVSEAPETSLTCLSESIAPIPLDEFPVRDAEQFFNAMDTYKQNFLNEVKVEIRSVVRQEVLEEIKKEISKGNSCTVQSLKDSIRTSTANTKAEFQELSGTLERASELTSDSLQYLSKSIANVSIETTEEIFSLSKQLSETMEELSHYVDVTNNEISGLTETISQDRKHFIEERDQYRHEIRRREVAFQNMLSGFRDVAIAKEKKWWNFWS